MRSQAFTFALALFAAACAPRASLPRRAAGPPSAACAPPPVRSLGPIRAVGYPVPIRTGVNDPAHHAGFTSDGELFGGCHTDGGLGAIHCAFVDRAGAWHRQSNTAEAEKDIADGPEQRAIEAWLRARGVPAVVEAGSETTGPPLVGQWKYASDLELHFESRAGELDGEGRVVSQPALLVGGRVKGHPPVHPFVITTEEGRGTEMELYGVVPNGVALSPDGRELGVLAAWYGMEFAGAFAVLRVNVDTFAARVYAKTAEVLRARGDERGARALLVEARRADARITVAK